MMDLNGARRLQSFSFAGSWRLVEPGAITPSGTQIFGFPVSAHSWLHGIASWMASSGYSPRYLSVPSSAFLLMPPLASAALALYRPAAPWTAQWRWLVSPNARHACLRGYALFLRERTPPLG